MAYKNDLHQLWNKIVLCEGGCTYQCSICDGRSLGTDMQGEDLATHEVRRRFCNTERDHVQKEDCDKCLPSSYDRKVRRLRHDVLEGKKRRRTSRAAVTVVFSQQHEDDQADSLASNSANCWRNMLETA